MKKNRPTSVRQNLPAKKTMFIEFFSIVFGVLLALALNEWRAQQLHESRAESALKNIENELHSNLDILTIIHENNMATIKAMSEKKDDETITDRKFIPGLQLRETAWETFLSTSVSSHVQYEIVFMLSETYSLQKVYKQTGTLLVEASMNMAAYAAANGREVGNDTFEKQFFDYFQLLIKVEQELLTSYQKVLAQIEEGKEVT